MNKRAQTDGAYLVAVILLVFMLVFLIFAIVALNYTSVFSKAYSKSCQTKQVPYTTLETYTEQVPVQNPNNIIYDRYGYPLSTRYDYEDLDYTSDFDRYSRRDGDEIEEEIIVEVRNRDNRCGDFNVEVSFNPEDGRTVTRDRTRNICPGDTEEFDFTYTHNEDNDVSVSYDVDSESSYTNNYGYNYNTIQYKTVTKTRPVVKYQTVTECN